MLEKKNAFRDFEFFKNILFVKKKSAASKIKSSTAWHTYDNLISIYQSFILMIFILVSNHLFQSVLINQFVLPTFCLCFSFTGINIRGMLHHVYGLSMTKAGYRPIRTRTCRGTNWLINYILKEQKDMAQEETSVYQ